MPAPRWQHTCPERRWKPAGRVRRATSHPATAPGLPFLRRLHWIITPDPASEKEIARLFDAVSGGGSANPGELWRYTSPYRGLEAMEEKDSDYFFGRAFYFFQGLG